MSIDSLRLTIRSAIAAIAKGLNQATGGRLTPDTVTTVGLVMHLPIGWFIATGRLELAALLLVIFGLFDVLDGELARLQKRASTWGMVYDAGTDRLKEVILFAGSTYYLATVGHQAHWAFVPALAGCLAIAVAYLKAKGEVVVVLKGKIKDHHAVNHYFSEWPIDFDVLMFIVILGLVVNQLLAAMALLAGLGIIAVVNLLYRIKKEL
jgi:phosphatidylglycerophosphate synthase